MSLKTSSLCSFLSIKLWVPLCKAGFLWFDCVIHDKFRATARTVGRLEPLRVALCIKSKSLAIRQNLDLRFFASQYLAALLLYVLYAKASHVSFKFLVITPNFAFFIFDKLWNLVERCCHCWLTLVDWFYFDSHKMILLFDQGCFNNIASDIWDDWVLISCKLKQFLLGLGSHCFLLHFSHLLVHSFEFFNRWRRCLVGSNILFSGVTRWCQEELQVWLLSHDKVAKLGSSLALLLLFYCVLLALTLVWSAIFLASNFVIVVPSFCVDCCLNIWCSELCLLEVSLHFWFCC